MRTNVKPKFKYDCPQCKFIGHCETRVEGGEDFYCCDGQIVAVDRDDATEFAYSDVCDASQCNRIFAEASRIAIKKGFAKQGQKPAKKLHDCEPPPASLVRHIRSKFE